jgi:hypothetical protein
MGGRPTGESGRKETSRFWAAGIGKPTPVQLTAERRFTAYVRLRKYRTEAVRLIGMSVAECFETERCWANQRV